MTFKWTTEEDVHHDPTLSFLQVPPSNSIRKSLGHQFNIT